MIFFGLFLFISEVKNSVSSYVQLAEESKEINFLKSKSHHPVSYHRKSLLFVSTVDGRVTCLNKNSGEFMWAFDLKEPLLSSSISSIKVKADLWKASFIPSLDGTLYKWNGGYLESLSLSTDFLLGQMKKLPDGKFVVGGTNVGVYGIDLRTGKILYESSGRGCKPTGREKIVNRDILSLRKSQHTVRAVDRVTGHESWNYSVGKYEMELAESNMELEINTPHDEQEQTDLHFLVRDGIISNTATAWSFKLDSPITDAWQLDNDSLKPIDIFKHGLFEGIKGLPGKGLDRETYMFLGVHEGQMYIQKPTGNHRKRSKSQKSTPLQVDVSEWRPFISTSTSRTPTLNNKKLTALSTLDYPFDNGFVLISNSSPSAMIVSNPDIDQDEMDIDVCDINNGNNCEFANVPEAPFTEIVPLTFKDWWKEILILSILIAVGINIGIKFLKRKLDKKISKPTFDLQFDNIDETSEKKASFSKAEFTNVSSDRTISMTASYDSRYIDDFEHVECLGKGGFGVVFKAKKKIDDCEYAIKRIYLPHCDEAKAKMMREVKALAALDHVGIVRYFHAWWEEPPSDWQKTTDKAFLMKDSVYSNSYGLSQDWVLEVEDISESNTPFLATPSRTEKRTSDDPLGKRFNFDTGIEELISDHKEFDLLKHNDVFYADEEEYVVAIENDNESQVDDSFIIFDSNCSSTSQSQGSESFMQRQCDSTGSMLSDGTRGSRKKTLTANETDSCIISDEDYETNKFNRYCSIKERTKRRLVGKCCAQSSSCLTKPPLFLYIQMQLCKTETLKDWLKNQTDKICLLKSMEIFMQIVNAVQYFHNLGLMHRDLKPANILFSLDGSVKVGDFGLVTAITRPSIGKHQGKSLNDENHTGQVGTQLYMSPEQASGKPYCHKIDIFSLGLILFELVSAFSTQMERMQVIYRLKQGVLSSELLGTPQGKLVEILTAENPDLRPEASEIKQHVLINEINNNISNSTSSDFTEPCIT